MLMKYVLDFTPAGSLARSKSALGVFVVKWYNYSPQMIEKFDLKGFPLAKASILGQPLRAFKA